MKIDSYHRVKSADEAYAILTDKPGSVILGGGGWLKLSPKVIENAIDLSDAGLNDITEENGMYKIGAMVTLRQLETYGPFKEYFDGIIPECTGSIMGIAVRNIATAGGTAAGRYGFSDLLPVLMALDAELEFHKKGRKSLSDFMEESGPIKDVLTYIYLKKDSGRGYFTTLKNTAIDFPILNGAVTRLNEKINIVIGARPYKAVMAAEAMEFINNAKTPSSDDIKEAAAIACGELKFGKNSNGSAEYRRELCRTFVQRGLKEVLS